MHTNIKKLLPRHIKRLYHFILALAGALLYRFPSRQLTIIAVTGTKGKTSTAEIVNSILEVAGHKTALAGTVRFKIGQNNLPNTMRMTMPGRFFLQKFLRRAVSENCTHAVIEMTSEGARQFRHRFVDMNCLIYTNLAPEHIESHGSFEKYRQAKRDIVVQLQRSRKKNKLLVVNADDQEGRHLQTAYQQNRHITVQEFSLKHVENLERMSRGMKFRWHGTNFATNLEGQFNLSNILAALTWAEHAGLPKRVLAKGLSVLTGIPGRVQDIDIGQPFRVIVDYAHTPDSLRAVYEYLRENRAPQATNRRIICVLGATGGGRDKWKRPEMGRIAAEYCDKIILTNEDPYDENPQKIVNEISSGIPKYQIPNTKYNINRREAIRSAIAEAKAGDAVIITGKGTDPSICGPGGAQIPWSDARVALEELNEHHNV